MVQLVVRLAESPVFVKEVAGDADFDEGCLREAHRVLVQKQLGSYEHAARLEQLIQQVSPTLPLAEIAEDIIHSKKRKRTDFAAEMGKARACPKYFSVSTCVLQLNLSLLSHCRPWASGRARQLCQQKATHCCQILTSPATSKQYMSPR